MSLGAERPRTIADITNSSKFAAFSQFSIHPSFEANSTHFHLPKTLHGKRELAGEISIIVVGVHIALFFGQLVQRWEWNHKVEAVESAMKHELLWDDGTQLYQRSPALL